MLCSGQHWNFLSSVWFGQLFTKLTKYILKMRWTLATSSSHWSATTILNDSHEIVYCSRCRCRSRSKAGMPCSRHQHHQMRWYVFLTLINKHLKTTFDMAFLCVSRHTQKTTHCIFCFCVLCNVFHTFTWPRTKRKFCTMNFCSIGFYQFLKVVTPVHRHCSVNVPQLTFAIKKECSPMWWNEMTLKSKRVIFK